MEVIVMKVKRKEGGAMVTGVIGAGLGPFAGDGLDEALGLAIGLGAVRSGEAVFDAELEAGVGEEFGAIGGAAVGEEALDLDAMSFVEADGLLEGREDAGSLFVWEERGESEAGVIVDGDVEALDAGAWIAVGAVAGGADAGPCEAAQLLDVEVEKFARRSAFVADDRRFRRLQRSEAVEAVAAQDAGEGGLGDGAGPCESERRNGVRGARRGSGFRAGQKFCGAGGAGPRNGPGGAGGNPPAGRGRASAAPSFRRRQKSWR